MDLEKTTITTSTNRCVEILRKYSDKIFVFNDNLQRKEDGSQTLIRNEPNAFGITTKRKPGLQHDSFFSDTSEELQLINDDLGKLFFLALTKDIVFPSSGVGTGSGGLKEHSPKIWKILNDTLLFYFCFKNPN